MDEPIPAGLLSDGKARPGERTDALGLAAILRASLRLIDGQEKDSGDLSTAIEAGLEGISAALGRSVALSDKDSMPLDRAEAAEIQAAEMHAGEIQADEIFGRSLCLVLGPGAPLSAELRAGLEGYLAGVEAAMARCPRVAAQPELVDRGAAPGWGDAELRMVFDFSPIGALLIDRETGRILDANASFRSFGGWRMDEVLGRSLDDFLTKEARRLRWLAILQLMRQNRFGPVEYRFRRPDGSEFPVVIRGLAPPGDGKGRIVWLLVEDMSQHYRVLDLMNAHHAEALRARAELAAAFEALPHGLVVFDAEDRVSFCNDNMRRIFHGMEDLFEKGARHIDILREGLRRGMFPEAVGREEEFVEEVVENRKARRFERVTELSDGRHVRVIEVAIPSGGRVGLRIDVSAEYENARRLQDVIEGSQAGTWSVDLVTGKNVVNDRWAEMLGWRRDELEPITTATWQSLIHPQDAPEVEESVLRLLRGEASQYEHTYRMRHAEGHWVWINDRGRISAWDAQGKPSRMAGVHVDISVLKETEQRLEDIIDGAEVGTWQYNTRTGENLINDRWAEILGYRHDELAPMGPAGWRALVHPEDYEKLQVQQETHLRSGQVRFRNEIRLRHKKGHWVWVLSRGRVTTFAEDGMPLIMSGVHLDISTRKRLETAFRTERDFLAQLMETSVSGILAVDDEGRVIFCNAEVARQLEVPLDQLYGQICDPVLLGLKGDAGQSITLEDMPCQMCIRSESGLVRDVRLRLVRPNGRQKVLSVNGARTKDPDQKAQVVLTVTDMTDAAEAEARLREALERAEAANRAKSRFLANMSHELRTPLNGVLGMAELLTGQEDIEERRRMVETIRESATHLLSIVNDILDLAKVESGTLELSLRPLDLGSLAERVERMHRITAESKGLHFHVTIDPALQAPRMGDDQRVVQIMHNLVGNALKFSEKGRVVMEIRALDGERIRITVSDTGIGMSREEVGQVFNEFTQADGTITRRFGGTGLGLSIVRRLVELMQGTVRVDSAKGHGTTLIVDLRMPLAEGRQGVPAPGSGGGDLASLKSLRALVAEDNATNTIILKAMLERLGMTARFVANGEDVVAQWEPGQFDLLFLDISMPGKDGITALAELREKAGQAGLPPAIAVTANAMTHHVDSYHRAGFAGVVAKPIRLEYLARAVRAALRI